MRAFVLLTFLLASCTSYGSGVEANWVSQKTLKVSGAGNGLTTDGRIEDYVMLKAAEKAMEAGYRYFIVSNSENTGAVENYTVNAPYHTTVSARTYGGVYGPATTFATATTTGGPQTYNIYKPGRDAVFVMFDERPKGYRQSQYFEVASVYNELGSKYLRDFQPIEGLDEDRQQDEAPLIDQDAVSVTTRTQGESAPERISGVLRPIPATAERDMPTLDEIYRSLSPSEKATVNRMPPGERADYLQEIRNLRY